MSSGADEAAREKCLGTGNIISKIFIAQGTASVSAKRNKASSVRRKGEQNEAQVILLCAVPEVAE